MSSAPSAGQKVTNDPRAGNAINEAVGVVTSDSLAAESMNAGGSFGSDNPHAAPMKQPSKSTNTNTTDTSAATKLEAAPNSGLRDEATQPFHGTKELDERGHARQDSGIGPNRTPRERDGGTGGAEIVEDKKAGSNNQTSHTSSSNKQSSTSNNKSSTPTGPSAQAFNIAPTAAYEHSGNVADTKVHGKNLKSGDAADFKGDEPNASFSAEVGTEDDPGRRAAEQYQYRNTQSAEDTAKQGKSAEEGGVYAALKSEEQA
jgi:hypothetical protein